MLDRIIKAFTKPRLYQTPIDEAIVAVIGLVVLAIVGVVGFLIWQWLVGGPEHPLVRQTKREASAPRVGPPQWHYGDKTTSSPAPPPKRGGENARPVGARPSPPPAPPLPRI